MARKPVKSVTVTITKTIVESNWGFDDLISCLDDDAPESAIHEGIIELLQEDVTEILEDAKWSVEVNYEEGKEQSC